jgi:hypothetical protein
MLHKRVLTCGPHSKLTSLDRRDNLPALDEYVKRIKIKNPITQEFNGTYGVYTQQNVEKQRSYNLPEWKALTEETQHQPPAKRGERRRNQEKVVRGGLRTRAAANAAAEADDSSKEKRKPGRPRRAQQSTEEPESEDDEPEAKKTRESTPADSPAPKAAKGKGGAKTKSTRAPKGGQAKSVTSRRLNNTAESADHIDEKAFKNFDYRMDGLEDFTPERCAELETHYWKSLAFNQPMYAADMPGSLFDDKTSSWNVAKLPNLLDVLGTKVPGVNTAYLYMGMWKATFAWHLEDVDLYSINYIHFGAPKQWYSISQEDARKFEAAMKSVWPVDAKNCDQFLRHKTYLISPDVLQKQYNVKVNKLVHYEGEFVITYPYGYHSGYNLGYNCAESVNFATESWLEYGRIARKCNCEADNVWVDVAEIERKLRGEPTPEYYEETDDDDDDLSDEEAGNLPSPPASVKGKSKRGQKRKRDVKEEKPKKKKKIKIRIRAPTREPCVMCPNDNPWEPLLPTDTGKKVHRSCALWTPETWIEKDDNGNETAFGVNTIDRARLELKCNFCRSKRGACFQCSSKKCTRAFHATCALAAGVLIDGGLVPTFGEDGTEYFEEGFDFRCKYHRPKMPKKVDLEALESSKRINNYAKELKFNDVVQAQYVGGEVFAGLVVENRPAELTVVVDVLPEGYVTCLFLRHDRCANQCSCSDRMEVEWKYLCVLDTDDSQRPKPSATAIPMPEGMNKKAVSVNNRQDGVPEQGELFHDNPDYKFCDFYNMHTPPPGYTSKLLTTAQKLRVDLNAAHQLYHYIPSVSTEAKSFFAERAGSKQIAPKANFLDRMNVNPRQPVQYAKQQTLAAAKPAAPRPSMGVPTTLIGTIGNPANRSEKPYVYKPKEPARPNVMWGIDPQALATQRSFINQADRRASPFGLPALQPQPQLPQPQQPKIQYNYQGSDPMRNMAQPLRPFSREHYYSSDTLPAAMQGEYSGFIQQVRRQSQGAQSLTRPASQQSGAYTPNYQPVSQQKKEMKQSTPKAHTMGGAQPSALQPNAYGSSSSRPSSSAQSNQSPLGAPLTPATTTSTTSKTPETSHEYLANLSKYPYLRNSFLRSSKAYESPYPIGGGFAPAYKPLELDKPVDQRPAPPSTHTPSASVTSFTHGGRRGSQQWTPPSQVWHASGLNKQRTPPPPMPAQPPVQDHQQPPPRRYPQPVYQTTQEFQQSWQGMPSTASRDGAQARLIREQMAHGYGPYAPHGYAQPPAPLRNSFGHSYDTAKMWQQSPKAPTPSPLSDGTPGTAGMNQHHHTPTPSSIPWGNLPTPQPSGAPGGMIHRPGQPAPDNFGQNGAGYGPMLPQMGGGHETWRFT